MIQVIRKIQVRLIIRKIQETEREERLQLATELWNEIDLMESPEEYWNLMLDSLPDCFCDNHANSMRFTY
jgi:hypothetical protein